MRHAQQSGTEVDALPRAGQGGYTLIEVLIAVFLVGTVVAALAAGMLTMMSATRSTAEQQRLEAGILNYTEYLRAQTYVDCAGSYPTWTGDGVSGEVDEVSYWQIDSGLAWGAAPYTDTCTTDRGRQLVDVVVRLDGGPEARAQVVLRRGA